MNTIVQFAHHRVLYEVNELFPQEIILLGNQVTSRRAHDSIFGGSNSPCARTVLFIQKKESKLGTLNLNFGPQHLSSHGALCLV